MEKHKLNLPARSVSEVREDQIVSLPDDLRTFLRRLKDEARAVRALLESAQPRHLDDVLRFAGRAWRRPITNEESVRLRSFYEALRRDSQFDHPAAVRALLARILVAPDFLYRIEKPSSESGVTALSDWELATRLSYFLWSSPPDAELRRAAAAGELRTPEALIAQARRMMRDPRARRFAIEFFG